MDRLTKLVVIGSTVLAFGLLLDFNSHASGVLLPLAAAAFAVACIMEALIGDLMLGGVMFLLYLVPAIFLLVLGVRYRYAHASPWMAALLGCILVRSLRTGWAFPRPFKAPLVLWALSLSLAWPILVARELDFTLALLYASNAASSRANIPISIAIEWMLYVVCTSLIGLLFFDSLFAAYARGGVKRFEARVAWPLLAGCLVSGLVAAYQSFGHIDFLNPTIYAFFGRATGTMLDGNVFGSIAALWIPAVVALLFEAVGGRRPAAVLWTLALGVLGAGLFATGSRTGLLIAAAASPVVIVYAWRRLRGHRLIALGAAGAFVVVIAVVSIRTTPSPEGGLKRVRFLLGDGSAEAIRFSVGESLAPGGIRHGSDPGHSRAPGRRHWRWQLQHRGPGLGVPAHRAPDPRARQRAELVPAPAGGARAARQRRMDRLDGPFRLRAGQTPRPPGYSDARRRHQGRGSRLWVRVVSRHAGAGLCRLVDFRCLRVLEFAVGHACAGWRAGQRITLDARVERREWIAVLAIAVAFALGTAYAARNELRPPFRALAADWPYDYGFFDYEGPQQSVRWTGKHAVDVFPAPKPWLKLVVGGGPPGSAKVPIDVQVWRNHERILHFESTESSVYTIYVHVPEERRRVKGNLQVMIEIVTSRTWKPSDYGGGDRRDLGVRVDKWIFVDEPPPGSLRIE